MRRYKIALFPGDGVGQEVIAAGKDVVDAVSEIENFNIDWVPFDYGAKHYLETGEVLPEDALKEMGSCDAIYFGAIGDPKVPPGILEKGILLTLRFYFDEYVNLRPVKLLPNIPCPLKDKSPQDIDFAVIRENTEDFYVGIGGRAKSPHKNQILEIKRNLYNIKFGLDIETDAEEIAYQIGVISRKGAERIIKYAFDYAKRKNADLVTSVDKANVLTDIYSFWREQFLNVAKTYPGINTEFMYVDAIAMDFVRRPERYRVVVTPNMFGDILTDLGAMIQGGLGTAMSGNINPEGLSMFEPVHGSAPDIAGKGIANPLATILAGALMLDELGETGGSARIYKAVERILKDRKVLTPDLHGNASTGKVGKEIARIAGSQK